MEAYSMLDSFRSRIAAARKSNELFFAALIPAERIVSIFGKASAILESASVYTTRYKKAARYKKGHAQHIAFILRLGKFP
jgi:hypothetical protein